MPYDDVQFAGMQGGENALEIVAAADGVAIETGDARLREHAVELFFQLLRSGAEELHVLAGALGTGLRHRARIAAVVALEHAAALVMSHGNGAVLALHRVAAGAAENECRIAAAVQQQHDLFPARQAFADVAGELARDELFVAGFAELFAHVENFNFGQRAALDAIRQLDQGVLARARVVVGLQRRRRGAQHDGRAAVFILARMMATSRAW